MPKFSWPRVWDVVVGSLIAFAVVGVGLYFIWPTILSKTVAGLKTQATAQNITQSILDSFTKGW